MSRLTIVSDGAAMDFNGRSGCSGTRSLGNGGGQKRCSHQF
jgi:hypothetical protein